MIISSNLLTDKLAEEVAMEVILSSCEDVVRERIADSLSKELLDILAAYASEARRSAFFEKLFKSLDSHERMFASMINGIWEEQRKIIVANLKKMKKAWLEKDAVDQILYPRKQFEAKIAKEAKPLFEANMKERGDEELRKIDAELRKPRKQAPGLGIAFDVENPEVQKWLTDYTPKLSKNLEKVSTQKLRAELTEGMKAGEGVPLLTKRVNTTYEHWNKVRSETIARSEAMRASNKGALESYRQSGVVKKKIWIAEPDACHWCAPLDGKIVDIETSYFDMGDEYTVSVEGKGQTMKLDYETVETPPLHPRCRCSIAASFEDMAVMKPWRPAKTMNEARRFGLRNLVRAKGEVAYGKDICLKGANSINKNLYTLTKKYNKKPDFIGAPGEFKKWLRKIGSLDEAGKMGESDAFVQVVIDREGKRRIALVVNPLNYDEYDSMLAVADMAKDVLIPQGWCKYQDINTLIMHEYGHVLDFYKSDWFISNSLKFETDLIKVIVKEDKSIKQLLGGYAESGLQQEGKMYSETWAELFKLYEHDKTLLPGGLINLVEDSLGFK